MIDRMPQFFLKQLISHLLVLDINSQYKPGVEKSTSIILRPEHVPQQYSPLCHHC